MSATQRQPDEPTSGARPAAQPLPDIFNPVRRSIEGGTEALAGETRELLHARLFAASLMLAVGFGVFLVRDLVFPRPAPEIVFLHGGVFFLLVLSLVSLSGTWKPSLPQLRWLEVITFGTIVACFIASQSFGLHARLASQTLDGGELRVLFKVSIIGTLILVLTYGIFIPNTVRRAALVIVPMALAPLVAPLILGLTSPTFRAISEEATTAEKLTENALFLILGAATAIYGTHTINAFRTEAFQARRLNQYKLTKKLGAGGMGEVYLAEHHLLARPCAIKLIRPSLVSKPRVLARFELEVRATARLSHWNTVEVYDFGRTEDGTFYYVMEYLPGLSLQELVDRHGPLPPSRVIYLLRQACDALHEAHEAGLIHRDIKPPNIFAAYRGARYDVAKLLDFGLVKPIKDEDSAVLTREGMVTGSPLYMAPEQIMRQRTPDPRTDLYSMGAVAYFLLTGRPPFLSSDSMEVMVAQVRDPVVPPSVRLPGIPDDIEQVVLRCLEKRPEDRFENAESLARALLACQDSAGWSAEQAEAWWSKREPLDQPAAVAAGSQPPDIDSADLTQADESPTLGASQLEEPEWKSGGDGLGGLERRG